MKPTPIFIRNRDGRLINSLFGTNSPDPESVIKSDNGIILRYEKMESRRGFVETEFLIQLAISVPIGIAANVASNYLYNKIKSYLNPGDNISIGKSSIQVGGMDKLQETLSELLEEVRKQDPSQSI